VYNYVEIKLIMAEFNVIQKIKDVDQIEQFKKDFNEKETWINQIYEI